MAYRIKSVAARTGISPATLRAWERRYGLVSPKRSQGGYRLYSEADVALFTRVKSLVDSGFSASEAVTLVKCPPQDAPLAEVPTEAVERMREDLLGALLALDRIAADRIAQGVQALPIERRLETVMLPVLREIGARWARGEASVVQEHFASAFVREKMVAILDAFHTDGSGGREVLCAGTPGEFHELGLMAVAVYLALRAWRITYLGLNVPPPELRSVLETRRPALLCTSVMMPVTTEECLAFAHAFRSVAPPETRVVVGGTGVPPEAVGTPAEGLHLVRTMPELLTILS